MPNFGAKAPTRQLGGDDRQTPPKLIAWLERRYGKFDLDPCPIGGLSGLSMTWYGNVFVNPPYSNIMPWVEKAISELYSGGVGKIVMLVPAATDTAWFRAAFRHATDVIFLWPRVRFFKDGKQMGSPAFGSVVFAFYSGSSRDVSIQNWQEATSLWRPR